MAGNDSNTVLLIHADGTDGGTTFTDDSLGGNGGAGHTITAHGNAQVDTAQSKFGGASLLLDGTGDYLEIQNSDDFDLADQEFGVECWFKRAATSNNGGLISSWDHDAGEYRDLNIMVRDSDGDLPVAKVSTNGEDSGATEVQTSTAVNDTDWHHLLFCRDGNTLRLYLDGVQEDTAAFSGTVHDADRPLYIGSVNSGNDYLFTGHIDEVRIVKGACPINDPNDPLYISSGNPADGFTPPTSAYVVTFVGTGAGRAATLNTFAPRSAGRAAALAEFTGRASGYAAAGYDRYTGRGAGAARIVNTFVFCSAGRAAVLNTFSPRSAGVGAVLNTFTGRAQGKAIIYLQVTGRAQGRGRVANDLDSYELYRGIDAAPDVSAAAWETFDSLPHTTAALAAAPAGTERTYHLVLRARNQWGLVSQNVAAWTVTVDDAGAVVYDPPSAPQEYSADAVAGGVVTLTARYRPHVDAAADRATHWAIWLTTDGSDPDPDADPADATQSMVNADGVCRLDYDTAAQADGTTVKAVVRARRYEGETAVDSTNTTIVSAEADTDGPNAPTGVVTLAGVAQDGN